MSDQPILMYVDEYSSLLAALSTYRPTGTDPGLAQLLARCRRSPRTLGQR